MKTSLLCILPNPPREVKRERENRQVVYFSLDGVSLPTAKGEKPQKVGVTFGKQDTQLFLDTHFFFRQNLPKLQDGKHVMKVPVQLTLLPSNKEPFSNLYTCQLLRAPTEQDILEIGEDEGKVKAVQEAFKVLAKERN